jgi:hypothetical protein
MKNIILLALALFFTLNSFAQKDNGENLKNWIVDYTQSRSSYPGVNLDKLELNDKYTVAHFSFRNRSFGIQMIEACNTFHIRSKGKKIASFLKAENIPTRYIEENAFSCADESTSMKIPPGMFVRFRVFFTRIPEYLNSIDIIEYDGYKECEFDIFNLNISRKEPLPPSQFTMMKQKVNPNKINTPPPPVEKQENSIAQQQTKPEKPKPQVAKPPVKKPPVTKPKPREEEPVIASKSLPEPEKKEKIKIDPPAPIPPTKVENRDVAVRKEYQVKSKILQLELWDNDKEDGDQVSIMLNNRWVVKGVAVTKNKKKFEFPLQMGDNTLIFHADNLGTAPPNTAAIKFYDGSDEQTIILNSDMDKSEAIRLIRN